MASGAKILGSWKTGDLEPALTIRLTSDGAPVDLTSASSAAVTVGSAVPDGVLTIVDDGSEDLRGLVRYSWQAGETDSAGLYETEVRVTWSAGREQTFPGDHTRAVVRISDGLA